MELGNVVMFHIGRCGSTVLCDLLNQNQSIQCEGEIFHKFMKQELEGRICLNIKELLKEVEGRKVKPIQLIEIKFLESQHLSLFNIKIKEMINILIGYGYNRFIILERKNYLKRMISHCIAQETNTYYLSREFSPTLKQLNLNKDKIKLGIENHSLFYWFHIFEESYAELRYELSRYKNIEIIYEVDIENDPYLGYLKICDFLKVIPEHAILKYTKQNPFSFSETLINYNEIKSLFSNTKYEWMMNED